jgi:hypothetical protein
MLMILIDKGFMLLILVPICAVLFGKMAGSNGIWLLEESVAAMFYDH